MTQRKKLHWKKIYWRQIVKLVLCSKVNNLNNQKSKKDLVQSWGQWGIPGKSCALMELLRAKSGTIQGACLDLKTKYSWAWPREICCCARSMGHAWHVDQQPACPAFIHSPHWGSMLGLLQLFAWNLDFLLLKSQGKLIYICYSSWSWKQWRVTTFSLWGITLTQGFHDREGEEAASDFPEEASPRTTTE